MRRSPPPCEPWAGVGVGPFLEEEGSAAQVPGVSLAVVLSWASVSPSVKWRDVVLRCSGVTAEYTGQLCVQGSRMGHL